MRKTLIVTGLVTLALAEMLYAKNVVGASWTVGQEREIDEGHYAKLYAVTSGWRVWHFENKYGDSCTARKPAVGRAQAAPLGVSFSLWAYNGTPAVEISLSGSDREPSWALAGKHGSARGEYRLPGERFIKSGRGKGLN